MNRDAIFQKLTAEVQKQLPDYLVKNDIVTKNNGDLQRCLQIIPLENKQKEKTQTVGLNFYVDEILGSLEQLEITLVAAVSDIVNTFLEKYKESLPVINNVSKMHQKEFIMENVILELVNFPMNKDKFTEEQIVYSPFLDLAIVYRVLISREEEGRTSYLVTQPLLAKAAITEAELSEAARKNTLKKQGVHLQPLGSVISNIFKSHVPESGELSELLDFLEEDDDDVSMYVLSNQDPNMGFGSGVIVFEEVMEQIAQKLGDFYVLPSSVHEVMIVPNKAFEQTFYGDLEVLKSMVSEANDTAVMTQDLLSYNVYRYSAQENKLSIV